MSTTLSSTHRQALLRALTEAHARVHDAYPELHDDAFVAAHLPRWLGQH